MNDLTFIDRLDWSKLSAEVVHKINLLKIAANSTGDANTLHMIRRDLVLPNLDLLRRFCEAIKEGGE